MALYCLTGLPLGGPLGRAVHPKWSPSVPKCSPEPPKLRAPTIFEEAQQSRHKVSAEVFFFENPPRRVSGAPFFEFWTPREKVAFEIFEDPDLLGVAVPEVLKALLAQDEVVERIWNKLSDGRKRTICHSTMRIKNIDLQVERALEFFESEREKLVQKGKW